MPKEQRSLTCDKCNQTFRIYGTWYSHMKQKHNDAYIKCFHCKQLFKTVALRNAHYYRIASMPRD